jgi:hypothetical protein
MSMQITAAGYDLLRNPRLNKGTAFTDEERRARHIEGLLPPASITVELQVARLHAELANLDNDLQKYHLLSDLQARNETLLFYAVLMSNPASYMPIVYTPTVGGGMSEVRPHRSRGPRHVSADQRAWPTSRDLEQLASEGCTFHRCH